MSNGEKRRAAGGETLGTRSASSMVGIVRKGGGEQRSNRRRRESNADSGGRRGIYRREKGKRGQGFLRERNTHRPGGVRVRAFPFSASVGRENLPAALQLPSPCLFRLARRFHSVAPHYHISEPFYYYFFF